MRGAEAKQGDKKRGREGEGTAYDNKRGREEKGKVSV